MTLNNSDLEIWVKGHSRSLQTALFSWSYTCTRSSAIAERLCDASCHWIFC